MKLHGTTQSCCETKKAHINSTHFRFIIIIYVVYFLKYFVSQVFIPRSSDKYEVPSIR